MSREASTHAIARNTALQFLGRAVGMALGVVTVAVMTRHLGPTGFGEFTTAFTFLSLFATFVDFGLTLTTLQMISEHEEREETLLANLVGIRLLSGFVFFALAVAIGFAMPYTLGIKMAITLGSVSFLLGSVSQMLVGVYQKRLEMWRAATAEVVNRVVTLAGVGLVVILGGGLNEMMVALIVGNIGQLLAMVVLARNFVRIRPAADSPVWRHIVSHSWPIGLSIIFNLVYLRGDVVFLSLLRDQAEVGLYGAAYKVIDVLVVLPTMYMGLILPLLVHQWSNHQHDQFRSTMQKTFDFFAVIAVPLTFGAWVLGEPVMRLVAGEEFAASGDVLKVLMPAASIVFFGVLYGHTVVAIKKQKPLVFGYAAVAVLAVIGYAFAIPRFGMWGAAWVTVFAESLIAVIVFLVVARVTKIRPRLTGLGKSLFSAIVMVVLLQFVMNLPVLWEVLIGTIVYFTTLTAVGGLRLATLRSIFRDESHAEFRPT